MKTFDLTFEQPVAQMVFSCAGREIIPTVSADQHQRDQAQKLQNELAAKLIKSVEQQFTAMKEELAAMQPHLLSKAIEFAESFVKLMFECDSELVTEKIVSNFKVALADVEFSNDIKIYLHPEMVEMIGNPLRKASAQEIQIETDPLLELTDCRIDGGGKQRVARLQRHLELAKQHWLTKNASNDTNR